MDVREKIVYLVKNALRAYGKDLDEVVEQYEFIADFLIHSGVTVKEWVDVKDRLPEESGMYIVTANDGHAQRVSFVQWQKKNRMWNLTGARSYWRVTHWMPLPQPPKGE